MTELAQPVQNFQILHRMGVAGDRLGEGADLGPLKRVLRQEGRLRMGLVEPFDDGERLGQHRAIIEFQCRHQPLRIEREISGVALLAMAQMMRDVLDVDAFEIERDAHAPGGRTAEIAMQLHRAASRERRLEAAGRTLLRNSGRRTAAPFRWNCF